MEAKRGASVKERQRESRMRGRRGRTKVAEKRIKTDLKKR
jgi:hypothetical protein